MKNTLNSDVEQPKDYSEYWEVQVLTVRILQNCGIRVGVKDRLPVFRLWHLVNTRMTGIRKDKLLQLLQVLVTMRMAGMEPPNDGKIYIHSMSSLS